MTESIDEVQTRDVAVQVEDDQESIPEPVLEVVEGQLRCLTTEEKQAHPGYKYCTLTRYSYSYGPLRIEIPPGFLTDGSSGGPDYGCSWLFHDYLYASHEFSSGEECTREQADAVMKQILESERLGWYCRVFVFVSRVNCCGLFGRAWRRSGERGPQYIDQN